MRMSESGEVIMAETGTRTTDMHGLFGAVLGGFMASLVGYIVFSIFQMPAVSSSDRSLVFVVATGFAIAIAFMVAGAYAERSIPWLSASFLLASGFTTLWAVALSFAVEPRWAVPLMLGIGVVIGVVIGVRRFGRAAVAALPACGVA